MNYERIILELMGRIQVLEEQVAALMKGQTQEPELKPIKVTTDDIRQYIVSVKEAARKAGESSVILKSGEIHRELKLKSALPQVCNAMRQSMNSGDVVIHTTPSGNSSTIEIEYKV